jgi:hypothetical protein
LAEESPHDVGSTRNAQGERHQPVSFTQCSMDHHRDFQNGLAPLRRPRGWIDVIGLHILHDDQAERSRTQYHREDKRILEPSSRTEIDIYKLSLCMYGICMYGVCTYGVCMVHHYMPHQDSTHARTS